MNKKISLIFCGLIVYFFQGISFCQEDFWEEVTSPYGASLSNFVVSPSGDYFATSVSVVYRSQDSGKQWLHFDFPELGPEHPLVFTSQGTILMGAGPAIMRSTDNGETWSRVDTIDATIYTFAITQLNKIYVGSWKGLYCSTDDGQNWFATGLMNSNVYAIVINDSGWVLASVGGIVASYDEGVTWFHLLTGGVYPMVKSNNGYIFGGGSGRVYRSTNGGLDWSFSSVGLPNDVIVTLTINTNGFIFAGTRYTEGVYRSTDNGLTWTVVKNGLLNTYIYNLSVDLNGNVYVATGGGVFHSTDDGDSWQFMHIPNNGIVTFAPPTTSGVFAITGEYPQNPGVFFSTNRGETWQLRNSGLIAEHANCIIVNNNGDLYAATTAGVYVSSDNGRNWYGRGGGNFKVIAFDSLGNMFGAAWGPEVYRSTDNGWSWTLVFSDHWSESVTDLVVTPFNQIFCGRGTNVYRSTDNGINWTSASQGLPSGVFDFDVNALGNVFAVSNDNVYQTTNDGDSWVLITNGMNLQRLRSITINSQGTLFIVTLDGVYSSTNNGANWAQVNSGLTNLDINALGIDADGYLYAATEGASLFRTILSTTPVKDYPFGIPKSFTLQQNYPNPFNPSTQITFSVLKATNVTLKVYDILGQEIATVVNERKQPGEYNVTWNAEGVPSGMYFYRIVAGEFTQTKKMVVVK